MKACAWLVVGPLVLAGCGAATEKGPAGIEAAQTAILARGEVLSLACQACHSLQSGGRHLVGPNLYGVFSRAAGTAAGFDDYSAALRSSGIVWSPGALDRWLEDPGGFLPGTTMPFTGYQSAEDRAALIEFLLSATGAEASDAGE